MKEIRLPDKTKTDKADLIFVKGWDISFIKTETTFKKANGKRNQMIKDYKGDDIEGYKKNLIVDYQRQPCTWYWKLLGNRIYNKAKCYFYENIKLTGDVAIKKEAIQHLMDSNFGLSDGFSVSLNGDVLEIRKR